MPDVDLVSYIMSINATFWHLKLEMQQFMFVSFRVHADPQMFFNLTVPTADDFIIFCTAELVNCFLSINSNCFRNVDVWKNAASSLVNKNILMVLLKT